MVVSYYLHKFLKLYVSHTKEMSQLKAAIRGVLLKKLLLNIAIFMGKYLRYGLFLIELQAQA